jgi:hypothetical protein
MKKNKVKMKKSYSFNNSESTYFARYNFTNNISPFISSNMKEPLFLFIAFLITANTFHLIKTQVTMVKNHHRSFAVIDPSTGQVPPLGFFDPLVLTFYLLSKLHYESSML